MLQCYKIEFSYIYQWFFAVTFLKFSVTNFFRKPWKSLENTRFLAVTEFLMKCYRSFGFLYIGLHHHAKTMPQRALAVGYREAPTAHH